VSLAGGRAQMPHQTAHVVPPARNRRRISPWSRLRASVVTLPARSALSPIAADHELRQRTDILATSAARVAAGQNRPGHPHRLFPDSRAKTDGRCARRMRSHGKRREIGICIFNQAPEDPPPGPCRTSAIAAQTRGRQMIWAGGAELGAALRFRQICRVGDDVDEEFGIDSKRFFWNARETPEKAATDAGRATGGLHDGGGAPGAYGQNTSANRLAQPSGEHR